jgi:hypothetical protein
VERYHPEEQNDDSSDDKEHNEQIGIDRLMANSLHQNTNGQVERANRTIAQHPYRR